MIDLTAAAIAAAVGGRLIDLPENVVLTGPVIIDSRQTCPGALFVALPGENVDGHDFVAAAHAGGAAAALVSRDVPAGVPAIRVLDVRRALGDLAGHVLTALRDSSQPPVVVAVTGSVGKTTTKDLLAQVLAADGATVASAASFNNEIGLPLTVLRADRQTRYLVLEMGASGVGEIAYLTSVAPPDIAVVLGVGSAHLGEFGSVELIAQAKSEIVAGLVPGGCAVLNADDPQVMAMAALADRVFTFGRHQGDVTTAQVGIEPFGRSSFDLVVGRTRVRVDLGLHGEHNITNALATAAAAIAGGLAPGVVAEALTAAKTLSPHRMDLRERPDGVTILDDAYNANPDSMAAGLQAVTAMAAATGRRPVAVLGEMLELGEHTDGEHRRVGELAAELNIGLLVVVAESAAEIAAGAKATGGCIEVVQVPDNRAAKQVLDELLSPGDIVLVKASNGAGLWQLADELVGAAQ
jgi:UDP-N-acetylmuramoyl-tripeptide--D-alanyl-D-alanine ligase